MIVAHSVRREAGSSPVWGFSLTIRHIQDSQGTYKKVKIYKTVKCKTVKAHIRQFDKDKTVKKTADVFLASLIVAHSVRREAGSSPAFRVTS